MRGTDPGALLARTASKPNRLIALLLAVLLTVSFIPTYSWGDEPAQDGADVAAVSEVAADAEGAADAESADAADEAEVAASAEAASAESVASANEASDIAVAAATEPASSSNDVAVAAETQVSATMAVIGADAQGATETWSAAATYTLDAGATAADLSEMVFKAAGLTADYGVGDYGWYLNTIASPTDGRVLGWDAATGKYWQLFVNGKASELGASGVVLAEGDSVVWCYSAYGEALPGENDVVVDSNAAHPDVESSWPGYMAGNSAVELPAEGTSLPTDAAGQSWTADFSAEGGAVSEPVIVDGKLFIAAGSTLYTKSAATGETLYKTPLAAPIDSIARMAYAKGLVIVPLSGGRLQAVSATAATGSALSTVWLTEKLPATVTESGAEVEQQSLTTLTVNGDFLYFGTADGEAPNTGYLVCVNVNTGAVVWSNASSDAGYYWSGAAVAGEFAIVGDDAGNLTAVNAATGAVVSTLHVSDAALRSTTVLSADGKTAYVVSRDGVLHKVSVAANGALAETGSVKFAHSSTSTPTIVDGKIFVGGQSEQGDRFNQYTTYRYGSLSVIDEATLAVEREIIATVDGGHIGGLAAHASGDVKSMPLVVKQGDATYIYFTSNMKPGGVYSYRLGDAAATPMYAPAESQQQYTMSSVVAGADGTLYYINDSKTLFALGKVEAAPDPEPTPDPEPGQTPDNGNAGNNGSTGGAPVNGGAATSGGSGKGAVSGTAVAAGKTPVAASATSGEEAKAEESTDDAAEAAEESDDSAQESAAPEARSIDGDDDAMAISAYGLEDSAADETGMPVWAIVGIIVGVCGLGAVIAWAVAQRRKQGK